MLAPQLIRKACAPHNSEQCWPHRVKLLHTLPECFSKDHASLRFSEPKDKQRHISYLNAFFFKYALSLIRGEKKKKIKILNTECPSSFYACSFSLSSFLNLEVSHLAHMRPNHNVFVCFYKHLSLPLVPLLKTWGSLKYR